MDIALYSKLYFKRNKIFSPIKHLSPSLNYLKSQQLEKKKKNDYQLNLGSIKIFSSKKWNIIYNHTLHQNKLFDFLCNRKLIHPDHMTITGNQNKNIIEIRFFRKNLFNASLYQLQKELYNTTINPYLVGHVEYNQDKGHIKADTIYRARFITYDLNEEKKGICWELRFYKNIIQSVFIYNNKSCTPPIDNSMIHTIISDINFNNTSNEQYDYILKRCKILYKRINTSAKHNIINIAFPELIHAHNLALFLNKH